MPGWSHEAALDERRQSILALDRRQPGDPPPAAGHNELRTRFHAIEVLAEAIVEHPHAYLLGSLITM